MNLIEFEDYITKYNQLASMEWTTIYEHIKNEDSNIKNDLYSFAVLSKGSKENREKILEKELWEISVDSFGKSYFEKVYCNGKESINFKSGEFEDIYEYLIAIRTYYDKYKSTIEINPKFIWYQNLVKDNDTYLNPETDEVIIKINENTIEVKTKYLRDFLSAYEYICVICFDHRRFFEVDSKIEFYTKVEKDTNMIMRYYKNSYIYNEKNAIASICGKVIVDPFNEPCHNDYLKFTEEKKYENYIIGIDQDSGKDIEFTCNADMLANYYGANPNAPHFLTPVYFNKKILSNYISDTKNYEVTSSLIVYLDQWSLPYTVNEDNKVIVWLGDLSRIPYKEQKVWRSFNEAPTGPIEELFYKRQIECKRTESSIKEKGIFRKLDKINLIFSEKYGQVLFNEISSADKEIESAILIPATNSSPVYQNFLMQLCKVTVERINIKFIKKHLTSDVLEDDNGKPYGSRILLFKFLTSLNINSAKKLDNIFKIIYNSRNKLSGHIASVEEYNKVWMRDKNYKPNYISDAKAIVVSLYNALNDLIKELENGQD